MHYYEFNIKSYHAATAHLTNDEDLAYRRLMDMYYDTEEPIPTALPLLSRRLRVGIPELESVLSEFFFLTDKGWEHWYCNQKIEKHYRAKASHWAIRLSKAERCAIQASRNARKKNATPEWLTDEHKKEIQEIYKESQTLTESTSIKHEVDHIIPLKGATVCGLHVPWNLRAIPAYKNREKSNKLEAQ